MNSEAHPAAPPQPLLSLDCVSRRLAGRSIVSEITLGLNKGEVLGLLGVNGAGKTTTLRLLAGVLAPDTGTVRVEGRDLYDEPQLGRRLIGYLPEIPPLHSELTVAEFLNFCARLHGVTKAKIGCAVERAIERCELGDVRRRLIGALSKGYRQRVGIAQAILHEPDLIVLDEPASGLDPVQALKLRALIRSLRNEHAVLLSTHVLSDVVACCDRVAILHEGRLRHQGRLDAMGDHRRLRIRVARALTATDWSAIACVAHSEAIDTSQWQVTLRPDCTPADLAAEIVNRAWGLTDLRDDNTALEEIFLRIASSDPVSDPAVAEAA